MKRPPAWLPWTVALVFGLWAVASLFPRPEKSFQIAAFGRLPVLLNGRVQPLDSLARNALLQLRGKQTVLVDGRQSMPASQWILEVFTQPAAADGRKVFRIDHPELLSLLKLPENEKYFSYADLEDRLPDIDRQARRVQQKEDQQRTPFEKQTLRLYSNLLLYQRLKVSLQPEGTTNFVAELDAYRSAIPAGVVAVKAREAEKEFDKVAFDRLIEFLSRYNAQLQAAYPLIIPPADPAQSRDAWENMGASLMGVVHTDTLPAPVEAYAKMAVAYRDGQPEIFNRAVAGYGDWLSQHVPREQRKAYWEFAYNSLLAFYKGIVIYLLAFLLVCLSWFFNLNETFRRTALGLLIVAVLIHTAGLIFRMVLEGRPPVTNLYSSAIFIGWAASVIGLFIERIHRNGIGVAAASFIGFTTLIIAHNLGLGGDTMEMLRAVLDTNFWLATHVVTITIGYSAAFFAGFLGILYILLGLFTPMLQHRGAAAPNARTPDGQELGRVLGKMMYGSVCFAMFFSFIGTVLGGIWADQSWGRFWGWDPKENGALIIVIWNAIILHVRWAGMCRDRGLAGMAVYGNIVTSFSWFGVNMLGVGLHSYGFMDSAFFWLMAFMLSQVAIILLSFIPVNLWRSFRGRPPGLAA